MKRLNYVIRGIILCIGIFVALCVNTESQAGKHLNVVTQVKNKTTIEISWEKKSVSGYEIYRASCDKDGNRGRYKKIADVSGKKIKYIDKTAEYKKRYIYKVKAYQKKENKKSCKYQGLANAYTATGIPVWDEYLYCDGETTPNSIRLSGDAEGIVPDAFEIYRKEGSAKYKKIKTVKVTGKYNSLEYVDRKVTKGKTYSYKIRTYKKINGKKIYSKYSSVIKLTAVNRDASYVLNDNTQKRGKTKSIIVGLTSKEGNGDTLFEKRGALDYLCYKNMEEMVEIVNLVPVKYSYDNVNWKTFPKRGVKISENQTIFIMLEEENGKEFDFFSNEAYKSEIEWWLEHNNRESILTIDFVKATANTKINGEMYH